MFCIYQIYSSKLTKDQTLEILVKFTKNRY